MAFWNDDIEKIRHTLDIDESIDFQKTGWKLQRTGLLLILCVVALAAAGMFGDGMLSKRSMLQGETLLEYDRYFRFQAPMKLRFRMSEAEGHVIAFPNNYLSHFQVRSVLPEPTSTSAKNGSVQYVFDGKSDLEVTFYLEPEKTGTVSGVVIVDGQSFFINHFIFP